jgi:DNA (cytosine-5)-methyltransferase 1
MLPSAVLSLLPTPTVVDMGERKTLDEWDAWTAAMKARHNSGNGHGNSLSIEARRLLPTPTTTQRGTDARLSEREGARANLHNEVALFASTQSFGKYEDAVRRHEAAFGRAAPAPTEPTGRGGAPSLSPRFVEWMMVLPDGHVTDVPGVTRNQALKALGNGVVPAQSAEAVRWVLSHR